MDAPTLLREALERSGISKSELALRMRVTRARVSQLLVDPNPTVRTLERVAQALGMSLRVEMT